VLYSKILESLQNRFKFRLAMNGIPENYFLI
jgi:hypothetical protein